MEKCKTKILALLMLMLLVTYITNAQTQAEMNQNASDEFKMADAQLNKMYKQILVEYKRESVFV